MSLKLYRVKITMSPSLIGVDYSRAYVLAKDPTQAYTLYRTFLDTNNLGFTGGRTLESIELLAEADRYTDCGTLLLGEGVNIEGVEKNEEK